MADDFWSMRKARDVIEHAVRHPLTRSHRAPYLSGPPGIGKTALARAIFEKHKRTKKNPGGFTHFVQYVAPEREPTEMGLPMPNAERTAIYMMPLDEFIWPTGSRVFFFIDEIDKANAMSQNILGRMAHEHRVFHVVLPPNSFVLMAGNRLVDRAGGFTAPTHIKGRRTHLNVGVDATEWIEDVAIPFDLHPSVVSFIRTDEKMLHVFDPSADASPTPRSWTKVGEDLNTPKPPKMEHIERALMEGDIGVEATNTFWGHLTIYKELRPVEAIARDAASIELPTGDHRMAIMWAEVTALARFAKDGKKVEAVARYFQRLPEEHAFIGFKDIMLHHGMMALAGSKIGQKWLTDNAELINSTAEEKPDA